MHEDPGWMLHCFIHSLGNASNATPQHGNVSRCSRISLSYHVARQNSRICTDRSACCLRVPPMCLSYSFLQPTVRLFSSADTVSGSSNSPSFSNLRLASSRAQVCILQVVSKFPLFVRGKDPRSILLHSISNNCHHITRTHDVERNLPSLSFSLLTRS